MSQQYIDGRLATRRLCKLRGRHVYKYAIRIDLNERAALGLDNFQGRVQWVSVISDCPKAAAQWVLDQLPGRPCVEVTVYGPRGGVAAHRYQGWDSAVWSQLRQTRKAFTPNLKGMI